MGKLPDISCKHLITIEGLTREGCMPLEGSFILTTVSADRKLRPRLNAQVQSFICRYSVGIRVETVAHHDSSAQATGSGTRGAAPTKSVTHFR